MNFKLILLHTHSILMQVPHHFYKLVQLINEIQCSVVNVPGASNNKEEEYLCRFLFKPPI
jgi:hypothetical protein